MDTHHPGAYPASLTLSTMDHTLFTLTNILAANQYSPWGHSGTRGLCKSCTNFFSTILFLSGLDSWLVFAELAHYRRVCDYSTRAYYGSDKCEIACSRISLA